MSTTESGKVIRRAGVVSFFTLISRVAGLARDMAIAHAFGTRLSADAFFVAFRIPNLLRRLFAEGALTVSFVPVFTQSLKKSHEEAKRVVDVSFTAMVVILLLVSFVGILISPWLVHLTAWGFTKDPAKYELTVFLTRVMFPYLLLVSLAAWAMGVLNSVKHFSSPAASPIFMNLGIIFGALLLTRWFNPPVLGLAVGVLVGGVMQLSCHFPFLLQFDFWPKFSWDPHHPAIKRILGMMVPAAYGAAVYQFNVIIITLLASFLPGGSVSYLWYADRIMEFPLGVFGIAMATALLPSLSDHAADNKIGEFKDLFRQSLRATFFITIPAAVGLILLAHPIIHLLFERGSFSVNSTLQTARALIFFAAGLPFIATVRVTSNAFFSLQDARTPVRCANYAVLVNTALALILMFPMQHAGLALAVSGASLFNLAIHLYDLRKKIGLLGLRRIVKDLVPMVVASVAMGGLLLIFLQHAYHFVGLAVLITGSVVVYLILTLLFRSPEAVGIQRQLTRRFQ